MGTVGSSIFGLKGRRSPPLLLRFPLSNVYYKEVEDKLTGGGLKSRNLLLLDVNHEKICIKNKRPFLFRCKDKYNHILKLEKNPHLQTVKF